jgi:hypothetical protein
VALHSEFSHLAKIPSVLTVLSASGVTTAILSCLRLNQAIFALNPGLIPGKHLDRKIDRILSATLVSVKGNQGRSKKVLQFFIFSSRNFIQE